MVDSIKITALQDIGANIAYTTLVPVVNMAGTPTTQKSNLQNLGNLILNGAGGSYFPRAAQATLALSVANAAQPNITSVGTLTSLAVTGNITAGNVNGGNIIVANYYYGDGGFLTNVSSGSNYSNSNVANYLPTYTGNVGANWVIASYFMGNGHNLTFLPGANVQGTVSNAAYAANAGAANTATTATSATTAGTVTTAAQPNITSVGTLSTLNVSGNATVSGNLTVDGNLIYVNVETLSVVDPIIDLQTGPNGAAPVANSGKDVGTALNYYDTQARVAFMGWDVSNAEFGMASQATLANEVVTFNQYGNLRVGNIIGNGQALSGVAGANVTGIVSHANVAEYVNVQVANSNITTYSLALVDWIAGNHRIEAELNTLKFNANTHTLTTINVNANVITSNYFAGNGSNLSGIAGGNVTGTVANATYATSAGSATTAGTVTTNAQPNITSVGTLSNLSVTGNVSANYFVGVATDVSVEAVNNNYSYHMAFVTGSGDTTLHMDNDDNLQYNPSSGLLTANRIDVDYLSVDTNIISNLIPFSNVTQDLGNTTNRWKDIWLANSTIHMGDATISANGNSIVVDSITVTNGNVGTVGNIASLNLDGSSSNVLYGNGVFAPASGGGGAVISNGNSYANVTASNGNVVIGVNNDNMTWTFATDRKIYGLTDEDISIVAVDDGNEPRVFQQVVDNGLIPISQTRLEVGDFQIGFDLNGSANVWNFDRNGLRPPANGSFEQYDGNIRMYAMDAGSNPVASLQSVSNQNDPNIFTTIDATTTGANISVYNGGSNGGVGYTWRFDNNGLLTLPGNTVQIGSQYGSEAILASNVAFGIVSQGTAGMTALQWTDDVSNTSQFSAVYINDVSANVGDIQIRTGAVGNANIWKFGNDGNLTLPSNTFAVNYANGTQVSLGGGGNTGNVTFDNVTVQGVNGLNLSAGADFTANLAYLQVRAGDVASHIHLDTGNNSAYDLIVGDDQNYVQVSSTGNILLSAYDSNTSQYTWTLDYNGNLILAGGNSVIQSIANSSLDPTLPNVSTMTLTPDANYNSQVLVLDPTAPGHIHLRAYAFSNIDEPAANIFLGGENTAFEITSGANNQAVIHSNGKAWTFGNDGNISSDTLTFTTTFANVKTVEYQTAGVWDLYVEDSVTGSNTAISRLNVSFKDNLIDKPQVYIENTKESDGIALRWTFDENGNLNFPRDVAGNTDPYLSIFGGSTPTIQSTDVSLAGPANLAISADYFNLSGFSGDKIVFYADTGEMATDANMTLTTNLANTGNTSSWVFGADGNLTIPGTSGGFIKTVSNASIGIAAVDNGTNNPAQLLSLNSGSGAATSIVSAYSTNVAIQTNAAGAINTWAFDNTGNLTLPGNTLAINYANGTAAFGNIVSVNKDGNASNVLLGNGVFSSLPSPTSIVNGTSNIVVASSGNVTVGVAGTANVITATSTGANVTGTLNATGNVTAQGTGSNIIRRAFGLVASDVGVTLDDLTVTVSSATSQLTLSTSGSWQGTGWTETFAGGATATVNSWVNLPLNPGFNNASGAMNSQGNGCRCVISDQTPTAKVYQITVVRSGTSGAQWNISIERLV